MIEWGYRYDYGCKVGLLTRRLFGPRSGVTIRCHWRTGRVPTGHWIKAKLILKKPLPAYKTTTTRRHPLRIKLCRKGFRPSPL